MTPTINSNLDSLLEGYLKGELPTEQCVKLEIWLRVMRVAGIKETDLSRQEEQLLFQKISDNTIQSGEIDVFRPRYPLLLNRAFYRIAAILLLTAAILSAGYLGLKTPQASKPANHEKVQELTLSDGTMVRMSIAAKLGYYVKQGASYVSFSGEGFFNTPMNQEPLRISSETLLLVVRGTNFYLKSDKGVTEVRVLTGKVHVEGRTNHTGIDVFPMEKVIYQHGSIRKTTISRSDLMAIPFQKK